MKLGVRMWKTVIVALCTWSPLIGCAPADEDEVVLGLTEAALVAPQGATNTFDLGSWNLEWFGDASNGPSNDDLQLQNAAQVIGGADLDVWGLIEIVSSSKFASMLTRLPDYAGLLANDPSVVSGSSYYSASEQKVGLVYKRSVASVTDARLILTANDSDFAGRPPLQVKLRITLAGRSEDVVVIVVHNKCCSDSTSWQRRRNASNALKSYLDTNLPTQKVWVVGDFNDDVDTSIATGNPSPFANFVSDSARYTFATKALSDSGSSSTVGYPDMIDHHLDSNEAYATYLAGSVKVFRVDSDIPSYADTTSDHYPVLSRYTWGAGTGGSDGGADAGTDAGTDGGTDGGTGGAAQLALNEILANESSSDTAGEFVEIRNVGGASADLSGFTVSDASAVRHTFAAGTSLAAGKTIVVFGGAGFSAGASVSVAASTGTLSLGNSGDTVTLKNRTGTVVQTFVYPSSLANSDGVSMNRSPDGSATGTFVRHDTLSGLPRSAGARATGAAW